MLLAGVDEAGRGPVLGPLVIAGVVLHQDDLPNLVEQGLADSKKISPELREKLFDQIMAKVIDYKIVIIKAEEIDAKRISAENLNKIEINTMIEILSQIKDWSTAYVDACDANAEKFQLTLRNNINHNIIAEHFADQKYPVVSAASILAKVTRDREIEKAHIEFNYDFGSGYPNDPKTIRFLVDYFAKHRELPIIARKSWETAKKIIRENEQSNIDAFFKETQK
ncbi:MAG: ribonuclease HII [Candidatus Thorarchaeota archaeon]